MINKLTDTKFLISLLIIFSALIYDLSITFWKPMADPNLVSTIVGLLNGNGFVLAAQFWLGSSSGSKEKDETISQLKKNGS